MLHAYVLWTWTRIQHEDFRQCTERGDPLASTSQLRTLLFPMLSARDRDLLTPWHHHRFRRAEVGYFGLFCQLSRVRVRASILLTLVLNSCQSLF